MASLITGTLENLVRQMSNSLLYAKAESDDIQKIYFQKAQTDIAGYDATSPVTVATKLTKQEMENGITFLQQLNKFLDGTATTQGDYYATCINLCNGKTAAEAAVSPATEAVGTDLKTVATTMLDLYQKSKVVQDMYEDNEIDNIVDNISAERVIPGSSVTAALMSSGVTMARQYANFLGDSSVSTANYMSTVTNWQV